MKPVTTISRKESTPTIGTQVERVFLHKQVTYSLRRWKHRITLGYHIGLLLMAALQYLAPQFIEEGRLGWLRSPLYIVKNGKNETYYFTDEEMDAARGRISGIVQRNKGLGSLTEEQAHNSMFNPEYQRFDIFQTSPEARDLLCALMGKDVEPRTDFIFKNVDFSTIRE